MAQDCLRSGSSRQSRQGVAKGRRGNRKRVVQKQEVSWRKEPLLVSNIAGAEDEGGLQTDHQMCDQRSLVI